MIKLAEAAKKICEEHYDKQCFSGCPIRLACKSDKGRDQGGLDAWRERVNAAAEVFKADTILRA